MNKSQHLWTVWMSKVFKDFWSLLSSSHWYFFLCLYCLGGKQRQPWISKVGSEIMIISHLLWCYSLRKQPTFYDMAITGFPRNFILMTHHRSGYWCLISKETLRSFFRHHFMGNSVVGLRNVHTAVFMYKAATYKYYISLLFYLGLFWEYLCNGLRTAD